jgi:murein DD-endopeptidase MepM/ murein hydrolase activator NlpD
LSFLAEIKKTSVLVTSVSFILGGYLSQQSSLASKLQQQTKVLEKSLEQSIAVQKKIEQVYQKGQQLWSLSEPSIISPDQKMNTAWQEPKTKSSLLGHLEQIESYSDKIISDLEYTASQIKNNQEVSSHFPTQLPAAGLISSQYGYRQSPFATHQRNNHKGMDISASWGSPIFAAGKGIVRTAKYIQSYGNFIDIDHGNGIITRYAHASKLLVQKGDFIQPGQKIAKIGSTGRSTGPHLHFEVLLNGYPVNPENFLFKKLPFSKRLAIETKSTHNNKSDHAVGGGSL